MSRPHTNAHTRHRSDTRALGALGVQKKEKKTDNPREGWEDGTPPPHRDFKERSVVLAVAHPWESASSLPISLRSPSPILAATFMPPRGRPTLVVLSPVASSSVASLSSASFCDDDARLPIPCSRGFSRLPAQLRSPRSTWSTELHLECSRQPHIQGRGAKKRTQRAR